MLAKQRRLTTAQFDQYFKTGKRFHAPHLQVIYTPLNEFHGAVVVGKKVAKSAVKRNQLRRRLYSVLYQLQRHSTAGVYVVLTKPPAAQASFTTLKEELSELLSRIAKSR